ncbi:MAG: hypothetical protein R3Y13_04135 [bacterium]
MRESMGTTWIFGLVLTFIMMFSTFLVLSLNYSGVYANKNDVISILQKYEGYTTKSEKLILTYLGASGYLNRGQCPDDYYGVTSSDGTGSLGASKSLYCIQQTGKKYNIILFYKFNLPVIGNILDFRIIGQTNNIIISSSSGDYINIS